MLHIIGIMCVYIINGATFMYIMLKVKVLHKS